jgi:hypothetical protein
MSRTVRHRKVVAVAAGAFVLVLGIRHANAVDWTDEDCRRWIGTPQHAQCLAAHRELASADCSQWLRGGEEWVKCENARRSTRISKCMRYIGNDAKLGECLAESDNR